MGSFFPLGGGGRGELQYPHLPIIIASFAAPPKNPRMEKKRKETPQ